MTVITLSDRLVSANRRGVPFPKAWSSVRGWRRVQFDLLIVMLLRIVRQVFLKDRTAVVAVWVPVVVAAL